MSYRRVSSRINQLLRLTSSSSSIERFQKSSSPPFSINRSYSHMSNGSGLGSLFRPEPWLLRGQSTASASGLVFFPRFSSTVGGGSNKIEYMEDVAEVFVESTMEAAAQAPAVSEVAVAAADSYLPVAALQYVIDWVHTFTGLNWWAAIALTTLLMRGATIPILVNQLKATSKLSRAYFLPSAEGHGAPPWAPRHCAWALMRMGKAFGFRDSQATNFLTLDMLRNISNDHGGLLESNLMIYLLTKVFMVLIFPCDPSASMLRKSAALLPRWLGLTICLGLA
ncbi:hypothetical protein AMTR_s00032p00234210 [Amborella trichopoda]|uniref:Uncharacterized protein n=1 Tax=Amborella trichopoda TaxID=13333 RepID=U5CPE6_AMBTC|nr:hypothetical protein AMTR_s00032p00234210 [Amborella trichopoda]